ncbi:hypothetical protein ES708_15534 [subsurface metagenome]
MWDGKDYPDKKSALDVAQKYKKDGFETEVFEEEKKYYVFTRRVVEEVIVEGQPTI